MKISSFFVRIVLAVSCVLIFSAATAASDQTASLGTETISFSFLGDKYEHRWSKDGQNEFTPVGQNDLNTWIDMVTINVHAPVATGEQLAEIANRVLGNYQRAGQILRTDSKARTAKRPAEHLIAAVLGSRSFLEAAFARFVLIEGVGTVVVYSHRVYGETAGPAMSEWLQSNGPRVEKDLMAWDLVPTPTALNGLPQNN